MSNEFKVGQILLFVPSDSRRQPQEVKVSKVGRKWVQLGDPAWGNARFDKDTLVLDGHMYSSPGRVWLCAQDYEDERERIRLHSQLTALAKSYSYPFSTEQVRNAIAALTGGAQ